MLPDAISALSQRQFWFAHTDPGRAIEADADQVYYWFGQAMANDYARERRKMRAYVEKFHDMEKQCGKIRAVYERAAAV